MLCGEGVDVSHTLLLQDFVDGDEDAGLLDAAEALIDGGAEKAHGGAEVHVGTDQGGDVVTQTADLAVERAVVLTEVPFGEHLLEESGVMF